MYSTQVKGVDTITALHLQRQSCVSIKTYVKSLIDSRVHAFFAFTRLILVADSGPAAEKYRQVQ